MEYLKKKKLYELAKELLKDKEIPLMKDCEYKFGRGSEWLRFSGVGDDCHSYKINSQSAGKWVCIEESAFSDYECEMVVIRSDTYAERKNGEYTHHSVWERESAEKKKVETEIMRSGFNPTESLVKNIRMFSEMEGKEYSLRELAALYRKKPDFSNDLKKEECFNNIIKECQEQELERMQKPLHFAKQEMMMEEFQTLGA